MPSEVKSILLNMLNKQGVELGKTIRAWIPTTKLARSHIISGTVVYIHPEGRYVVIDTGLYKSAVHPFAIEYQGIFIDKIYQPEYEKVEELRGCYNV